MASVTLKDIAREANVTPATVSMVINNKPNISKATKERVLQIAKRLNY
jgi:LacI family transcriptional regulator